MKAAEWETIKARLAPEQVERIKAKCQWEHMSWMGVYLNWPDLFATTAEKETDEFDPHANALPRTDLTLDDARQKLAGWHFGQESLTRGEREILYVAEAVLRGLDALAAPAPEKEETQDG